MIFKLEMRYDFESDWVETVAGNEEEHRRWTSSEDAYQAFTATIQRWPTMSHRLLKVNENGEPLAVVAILDLGLIEQIRDDALFGEGDYV